MPNFWTNRLPHGRPIALRYSTRDILRGFHRI